ncbi:MAG TPA: FAD-binding oxidoreductase [Gemmatimonadales bacterium]|nr:FAD-binding oxidoreductase [Gemmatimonadales bacterium]
MSAPAKLEIDTDPALRSAYSEGAGIYRILPYGVAIPRSPAELVAFLRSDSSSRFVPRGAGSGMPGGNIGSGVVVDCSNFRTLALEPGRRIAHAGAGVTWKEVNDAAAQVGLRLPPDPSSGAFATSGGMVSTNAAGPRTVQSGSIRRWVESVDVVNYLGEARTVRRGGGPGPLRPHVDVLGRVAAGFPKTRKNSSGYAIDEFAKSGDELDLLIGSEGTLAFITAVEWRLEPIPKNVAGVALGFGDLEDLGDAVSYLLSLSPSAVELLDRTLLSFVQAPGLPPDLACLLLVEFERPTPAAARGVVGDAVRGLEGRTRHVQTAVDEQGLAELWSVRRLASPALARLPETRRSLQVIEDGCVPVEHLGAYIAGVRAAAEHLGLEITIFGHAGDGHVHVNALPDLSSSDWRERLATLYQDVTDLLVRLGGTPSGEHGDGRLRAGVLPRIFGPEAMKLFAEVKWSYDPLGKMNPGVIIPADGWSPISNLKVGPDAIPIPPPIARELRRIEREAGWSVAKSALAGLGT